MDFLYCNPNVMLIKNDYEIVVNTQEEGVCYVKVGRQTFHENHSGIMPSVTLVHKYVVPQKLLDKYKTYTVYFKKVVERKNNFPVVGKLLKKTYAFRPIEKTDDINAFYIADIHTDWDNAEKVSLYFGDKLDLYIVNGDFGESSSYENLRRLNKLIGDVTKGEIPSLVGRGNHDTRGLLAEKVTDYMATDDGRAYFEFNAGPLWGVIFDCGEDKYDNHPEYRSLNFFEQYRKDELKYLKKLKSKAAPFKFAVCHVPFMHDCAMSGQFDIMPDLYKKWGEEANRLGFEFMICGHTHTVRYIPVTGDEGDKFEHNYPVVVGVTKRHGYLSGTALTLKKSGSVMRIVGSDGDVSPEFKISEGFAEADGKAIKN